MLSVVVVVAMVTVIVSKSIFESMPVTIYPKNRCEPRAP